MSAAWVAEIEDALASVRALVGDLPEGPRRGLLLSTIEGCAARIGGRGPTPRRSWTRCMRR